MPNNYTEKPCYLVKIRNNYDRRCVTLRTKINTTANTSKNRKMQSLETLKPF